MSDFVSMMMPIGIAVGSLVLVVSLIMGVLLMLAPGWYQAKIKDNVIKTDDFMNLRPSNWEALQFLLLNRVAIGGHKKDTSKSYELALDDSEHVKGLKLSRLSKPEDAGSDNVLSSSPSSSSSTPSPIVIGTIRMGFGHHRIAYAASSWGMEASDMEKKNRTTVFHDLLNVKSEEADLIRDMDKLYSMGSQFASEFGGVAEKLWGVLTKAMGPNGLRVPAETAEHLVPILKGIPKDSPIIATHCFVAMAAVAAGFTNVINLVIDNHAQWFVLSPNCLNLVQGPSNYHSFLNMGVPAELVALAGHWIPKDLVDNIPLDCRRRIARAVKRNPLRILAPVGGAGAQKTFFCAFIKALSPLLKNGTVQLLLNAGDHKHMFAAFEKAIKANDLDCGRVDTIDGVREFQSNLLKSSDAEPANAVTLFAFPNYFPAVATTDILSRVSDVLAAKPSELAFYPIPKINVRRVGDHEAYSAIRSSEIGDGTFECRTIEASMEYVKLMTSNGNGELLTLMNEKIIANDKIGIYDGCKNAVKIALERAKNGAKKDQ